jgi:hypothetical protein
MVIIGMITTITFFAFKAEGQKVKGWFLAGSYPKGYDIGVENNVERNGHVAFLKSVKSLKADKFGTILQTFIPDDYLGKRVRLTGYLKTNIIKGWVGMWFRIDGDRAKPLGFDNMQDRKIKGITDWKKYEIVLDVPANSKYIAYGVLLAGSGTVWLDDLRFEVVSKDVSDTNMMPKNKPQNTSFEESEK